MPEPSTMKGVKVQMAADEIELLIYGYIGEELFEESSTARSVTQTLLDNAEVGLIRVRINSQGGNPFDGMAMYNALKNHKGRVEVHVDGIAASAATLPMMAGDRIVMHEGTAMMIHEPSMGAYGPADDLKNAVKMLETMRTNAAQVYAERSGLGSDRVLQMMADTTWMLPEEAVTLGFATETAAPLQIAASVDLSSFTNVPEAVASMFQQKGTLMPETTTPTEPAKKPETKPEMKADTTKASKPKPDMSEGANTGTSTIDEPTNPKADPVLAERERIGAIMALKGPDTPQKLIQDGIRDGLTQEQVAMNILRHERGVRTPETPSAPAAHTRRDTQDDQVKFMAAGVCMRAGVAWDKLPVRGVRDPANMKATQERLANEGERFADCSMLEMAAHSLKVEGRPVPHSKQDLIEMATSTAAFSQIFTDSVNAMVSTGFEAAEDTSRVWTEEGSANDFKQHKDIKLNRGSGLKQLARGGTAPDATYDDQAETYEVKRYAEKFIIDDQDIIDDNFAALQRIPQDMGEEAGQLRPDIAYAILLANGNLQDGVALFAGAHGNLISAVLGSDGMAAGIAAMASQREQNRPLNIRPQYLIVPPALDRTAYQLLNSTEIRDSQSTNAAANGVANPYRSRGITPVTESRIDATGVTDPRTGTSYAGSDTNWFLAGSRRTVMIVYLRGSNRGPEVRRFNLDRGQWGIGWDIKMDIGGFARDFPALHKSNGTG